MLAAIKKISNSTGHLRELVSLLDSLWRTDPKGLEHTLSESAKDWPRHERIPLALRVLITEADDHKLRNVLRRVCESSKVPDAAKQPLYFVAALWGDEWATEFHSHFLRSHVDRVIRSGAGDFPALLWAQLCGAMLKQYSDPVDLKRLKQCLDRNGAGNSEYSGMVEALLELAEGGPEALASRLEAAVRRRRTSETDLKACFVLGATADASRAPLYEMVIREVRGQDWWSKGMRRRAMESLAFCALLGEPVRSAIGALLVEQKNKFTSRWSGGSHTAELISISAILWNIKDRLDEHIAEALQYIAAGSYKVNATYAIALLMLKSMELPAGTKVAPDDPSVSFSKDFLQYDSTLNFSYYWRCTPRRTKVN